MNFWDWSALFVYAGSIILASIMCYMIGKGQGIYLERERFRRYADERARAERSGRSR